MGTPYNVKRRGLYPIVCFFQEVLYIKKIIFKIVSIVMWIVTIFSVVLLICTFTSASSGGFLDLTNVVQYFLIGIGIGSGIIAALTAKLVRKSKYPAKKGVF